MSHILSSCDLLTVSLFPTCADLLPVMSVFLHHTTELHFQEMFPTWAHSHSNFGKHQSIMTEGVIWGQEYFRKLRLKLTPVTWLRQERKHYSFVMKPHGLFGIWPQQRWDLNTVADSFHSAYYFVNYERPWRLSFNIGASICDEDCVRGSFDGKNCHGNLTVAVCDKKKPQKTGRIWWY